VCLGFRGPVDVLGLVLATVFGTACLLSLGLLMAGTLRAEAPLAATNLIWVLMAGVGGLVAAQRGAWGTVVSYLPCGALGDVMRSAIGVGGIDIKAIIVPLIWGLVGTLAARRLFRFE